MTTERESRPGSDLAEVRAAQTAVGDIRAGRLVLLLDDRGAEPQGVLVAAAETITPELVNFMVVRGRGLVCAPMLPDRLQALEIPMMVERGTEDDSSPAMAFAVSVDARQGTTTGTSASDRALTLRALASPGTRPRDLCRPGHVIPVRAAPGGVLRRMGYPEAAVDLVRMAGLAPCSATCEVLAADGRMAGREELVQLASQHGLTMVSLRALPRGRIAIERLSWDGTWPPGPGVDVVSAPRDAPDSTASIRPVRAVAAVTIWVTDQDRALDFYVGKLGFVTRRDNQYVSGVRWVEIGLPGADVTLALICHTGGPTTERASRFTDVVLGTDDLAAAYDVLRRNGVEFRTPPTRQPWGSLYAELQDPDANVLMLIER